MLDFVIDYLAILSVFKTKDIAGAKGRFMYMGSIRIQHFNLFCSTMWSFNG